MMQNKAIKILTLTSKKYSTFIANLKINFFFLHLIGFLPENCHSVVLPQQPQRCKAILNLLQNHKMLQSGH